MSDVERRLARLGARGPRARRRARRPRTARGAAARAWSAPKRARQRVDRRGASAPSVVIPISSSRSAVFGPIPGKPRRGARERRTPPCAEDDEARGLLGVGGDLRDEPVRPDADREPGRSRPGCRPQPAHRRVRRDIRQLEVGLVETGDLDAIESRARAPSRRAARAVGVEVRRDEDRGRAQPARPCDGYRRADAKAARLVGGGRHYRPRPLPATTRACPRARGGAGARPRVEGVDVEVRDAPLHARQATPRLGRLLACVVDRARGP